jgi:AcrR family transcriptional regulator
MEQSKNIEKRILWVAERLFLEKGFSGTSTTEIAKAVGCNQALIHYYFRTKEKLFWDVFSPKMEQLVEYLDAPLEEEGDFFYEDFSGHIVRDDKLVRLIAMPNVLVTSHQAFLTEEALSNIAETTIDNLQRFFAGDPNPTPEVRYEDVAHI